MHGPLSRRCVLAALGTALAGCSASESSSTPDCTTSALDRGDADAIQQASVVPDGEDLHLRVSLTADAADAGEVDRLLATDGVGTEFVVPTTGRRTYEQWIGERPRHGRFRVLALGEDEFDRDAVGTLGPRLDSLTVEFHCPADGRDG